MTNNSGQTLSGMGIDGDEVVQMGGYDMHLGEEEKHQKENKAELDRHRDEYNDKHFNNMMSHNWGVKYEDRLTVEEYNEKFKKIQKEKELIEKNKEELEKTKVERIEINLLKIQTDYLIEKILEFQNIKVYEYEQDNHKIDDKYMHKLNTGINRSVQMLKDIVMSTGDKSIRVNEQIIIDPDKIRIKDLR